MDSPRRGSLLVIFLTVFIDLLGFGMVLPLLPIYAKHFSTDESGVILGLLMASFSIMQFIFAPYWGRLSDRIGRRPVLMIGLVGSIVFYTLFGIATVWRSLTLLFVSRIGAGIAGATISTAQAYIADTTSLEKRPKGMALIGMAFGLGFTLGPLFGSLALPWDEPIFAPVLADAAAAQLPSVQLRGRSMTPSEEAATTDTGGPPVSTTQSPSLEELEQAEHLGPWPGYAAAILSAVALLMAIFMLPESLHATSDSASRKRFSLAAIREAMAAPSIGLILLTIFVSVFSFANLETTLSLILKGRSLHIHTPFSFNARQVLLTFAYIGLVLAFVQGGLVRPLAGRLSEGTMAAFGMAVQIAAFLWVTRILRDPHPSTLSVFGMLAMCTSGFAFVTPSLNSLLSRRSDPAKQGAIFGLAQSINSLARILGAGLGIPLLMAWELLPYYLAAALMTIGLVLVIIASRSGKDFPAEGKPATMH